VTASAWRRRAVLLGAAAAFFCANLGFYLWYRSTTFVRAEALKAERSALAAQVAGNEREAAQLNAQRERIAGVSQAIQEFYGNRVGRSRETLAPLVNEMHDIFRAVGIFPAQISYATSPVESLSLTEMRVSFGYATDYPTFKRLLAAIESGSRWIVVRQFGLTRDASMPSTVQMRMVLSTYFSEEGESGRPPARRASGSGPARRRAAP
jgi:Tfp pilus assembly protein PilO